MSVLVAFLKAWILVALSSSALASAGSQSAPLSGVSTWALQRTQGLEIDLSRSDKDCTIPFVKQGFSLAHALNDFDAANPGVLQSNDMGQGRLPFRVVDELRTRYVVGDFNTQEMIDGRKQCRGIEESYADAEDLAELHQSPAARENFLSQVERFRPKEPLRKPRTLQFRGAEWCIGQRLIACDMEVQGRRVVLRKFGRFVASSKNSDHMFDGYYAPINRIAQRAWDERPYTQIDYQRDLLTGGSKGQVINVFEGRIPMPNFMYFVGLPGFRFADGNGIHEKTAAEGFEMRDFMGAPISLGCVRLNDYPAKFVRWFLPRGGRFFIHYERELYQKFPPKAE